MFDIVSFFRILHFQFVAETDFQVEICEVRLLAYMLADSDFQFLVERDFAAE